MKTLLTKVVDIVKWKITIEHNENKYMFYVDSVNDKSILLKKVIEKIEDDK